MVGLILYNSEISPGLLSTCSIICSLIILDSTERPVKIFRRDKSISQVFSDFSSGYPSDVLIGTLIGFIGIIVSFYYLAPIFYEIILLIEYNSPLEIFSKMINPYLYSSPLYVLLCVIVFGLIILSSVYKVLEAFIQGKKNKEK